MAAAAAAAAAVAAAAAAAANVTVDGEFLKLKCLRRLDK